MATKMPVFHLLVNNIMCAKHGLHKESCINEEAISLASEFQWVLNQLQQGQAQHKNYDVQLPESPQYTSYLVNQAQQEDYVNLNTVEPLYNRHNWAN